MTAFWRPRSTSFELTTRQSHEGLPELELIRALKVNPEKRHSELNERDIDSIDETQLIGVTGSAEWNRYRFSAMPTLPMIPIRMK